MRTIRAILLGGPHCGTEVHCPAVIAGINYEGIPYMKSQRRDDENRQVFIFEHSRKPKQEATK